MAGRTADDERPEYGLQFRRCTDDHAAQAAGGGRSDRKGTGLPSCVYPPVVLSPAIHGSLVLVFGCIILSTLFGLVGPYLMGIAIDRYHLGQTDAGLPRIALWMLAAYLLNNIFQTIADWIMAHISQRSLNRLRRDLFTHMQKSADQLISTAVRPAN